MQSNEPKLNDNLMPKSFKRTVSEHAQDVLAKLLAQYKDPKIGQRILAKKMGIHEKTFSRLMNFENKPTAQTVLKIFKVYFNEYDDKTVLKLVPPDLADYFKQNLVLDYDKAPQANFSEKVDLEIQNNPIFAEIYILAGTNPIHRDEIQLRYGIYGLDLISKMLAQNILKELHPSVYALGENQASFVDETILKTGLLLSTNFAKVLKGQELDNNFISFFAEGLSSIGFKKWLKIDQEAFRAKVELSKVPENLGTIRAFSFQVIDTLELKEKDNI